MRATGIKTRWVNSDRQLADVLTKPTAPAAAIQRLCTTGRWKIVWDAEFTSAKNLRKEKRDNHFKNQTGKTQFQSALEEDQKDTGLLSVSSKQQRLQKNIERIKE